MFSVVTTHQRCILQPCKKVFVPRQLLLTGISWDVDFRNRHVANKQWPFSLTICKIRLYQVLLAETGFLLLEIIEEGGRMASRMKRRQHEPQTRPYCLRNGLDFNKIHFWLSRSRILFSAFDTGTNSKDLFYWWWHKLAFHFPKQLYERLGREVYI